MNLAALEEASRRVASLENAQRLARIGSWDWDLVTNHIEWSEGVYEVFGIEKSELGITYEAFFERVHPDDRDYVTSVISRAVADPVAIFDVDHRIVTKNGGIVTVHVVGEVTFNADGKAVFLSGTVQDITERVMLERALRERDQRLVSMLQASASPIVGIDLEGTITVSNAAATRTFGYRPTELVGESIEKLVVSGLRLGKMESVEAAIQVTGRRKSGDTFPLEVYVSMTPGGREVVLTLIDVSERLAYAERAATSQKMEALGQVAAGVAHEFNNLLMTVSGNLELVREQSTEEAQSLIDELVFAVRRAKRLTQQLKTFVGTSEIEIEPVELNGALESFLELVRPMLGSNHPLTADIAPTLGRVRTDRKQLAQALLNLVINARDATMGGGPIVLRAGALELETPSFLYGRTLVQPGHYVELAVSDRGIGMPPEVQRRALDPFFTTKPVGSGTGLGLSMVYGLMQQSHGYIGIETAPGEGTTVSLLFPRDSAAQVGRVSRPSLDRPLEGRRVLVVDDEPTLLRVVRRFFEHEGCEVLVANDGDGALRLIEERGDIELLVSDVIMPSGIDGLELVRRVRDRAQLEIILMSAHTGEAGEHIRSLGDRIHFLAKPFSRRELLDVAESLLAPA